VCGQPKTSVTAAYDGAQPRFLIFASHKSSRMIAGTLSDPNPDVN